MASSQEADDERFAKLIDMAIGKAVDNATKSFATELDKLFAKWDSRVGALEMPLDVGPDAQLPQPIFDEEPIFDGEPVFDEEAIDEEASDSTARLRVDPPQAPSPPPPRRLPPPHHLPPSPPDPPDSAFTSTACLRVDPPQAPSPSASPADAPPRRAPAPPDPPPRGASWDYTLKLWSASVRTFRGHDRSARHPDVFDSASGNRIARVWDVRNLVPTLVIPAHDHEMLSLDWDKYDPSILGAASVGKSHDANGTDVHEVFDEMPPRYDGVLPLPDASLLQQLSDYKVEVDNDILGQPLLICDFGQPLLICDFVQAIGPGKVMVLPDMPLHWRPRKEGWLLPNPYDNRICLWHFASGSVSLVLDAPQLFAAHEELVEDAAWHMKDANIIGYVGDARRFGFYLFLQKYYSLSHEQNNADGVIARTSAAIQSSHGSTELHVLWDTGGAEWLRRAGLVSGIDQSILQSCSRGVMEIFHCLPRLVDHSMGLFKLFELIQWSSPILIILELWFIEISHAMSDLYRIWKPPWPFLIRQQKRGGEFWDDDSRREGLCAGNSDDNSVEILQVKLVLVDISKYSFLSYELDSFTNRNMGSRMIEDPCHPLQQMIVLMQWLSYYYEGKEHYNWSPLSPCLMAVTVGCMIYLANRLFTTLDSSSNMRSCACSSSQESIQGKLLNWYVLVHTLEYEDRAIYMFWLMWISVMFERLADKEVAVYYGDELKFSDVPMYASGSSNLQLEYLIKTSNQGGNAEESEMLSTVLLISMHETSSLHNSSMQWQISRQAHEIFSK